MYHGWDLSDAEPEPGPPAVSVRDLVVELGRFLRWFLSSGFAARVVGS